MKELWLKIKEALISALPITAIVYILALTPLFEFSVVELITFSVGAVLLILGQWQLRRKLIVKKLTQGPVNRRAVAYWRQTVLLCRLLRQRPDGELFTLAQKAKFSQHTLTGEELAILEAGLHSVQQQLKAKPLPYRLFCMLVFAVY